MIIPGVSGGVIAVIFGVYDKMIKSLYNLFKDFKKNFTFLFILFLGVIIGAIFFSRVLLFFYNKYEILTKFCFIGLILGGIPCLLKKVKEKTNKSINYFITLLFFTLSIIIFIVTKKMFTINLSNNLSFFNLFLSGVIYSVGKVLPGISSSLLLMIIGMYEFVLSLISNPFVYIFTNINLVLPFSLGLFFGIFILLIIVNKLLDKHFRIIYSSIIGFVLGQIPSLIPTYKLSINYIYGCVIMIFSLYLSYKISKK